MTESRNPLGTRTTLETNEGTAHLYSLDALEKAGLGNVSKLPFSIKILLETVVRNCDGTIVTEDDIKSLAGWNASDPGTDEVPFSPARVILQDFTGVPAVVDLAAMRSTMERLGGDPARINPAVPVDLVIDHSVQVDVFGTPLALARNAGGRSSSSETANATSFYVGASKRSRGFASFRRRRGSCTRSTSSTSRKW